MSLLQCLYTEIYCMYIQFCITWLEKITVMQHDATFTTVYRNICSWKAPLWRAKSIYSIDNPDVMTHSWSQPARRYPQIWVFSVTIRNGDGISPAIHTIHGYGKPHGCSIPHFCVNCLYIYIYIISLHWFGSGVFTRVHGYIVNIFAMSRSLNITVIILSQ